MDEDVQTNKRHPRDFLNPGRIRIQLFNDAGEPLGPIKSRTETLWRSQP